MIKKTGLEPLIRNYFFDIAGGKHSTEEARDKRDRRLHRLERTNPISLELLRVAHQSTYPIFFR